MIQTLKRYKEVGDTFVEDSTGFIVGYQWIDASNITRRTLYIANNMDTINQYSIAVCRYEMLDPASGLWYLIDTKDFMATMNDWVHATTGAYESTPYQDDTTQPIYEEDGITVKKYVQILKTGLVPQFQFWFNMLLPMYSPAMQDIQTRIYGATQFN